ncbi:MAG: DUF58 domain-containing protein, partial [bacterium]
AVWSVRGLQITREVSAEVHEGDEVAVTLEVRTRRMPRFFLEVHDVVPGLTGYRTPVPVVWPGRPVRLHYQATAMRRGLHAGGTTTVASSGLAGWFRAMRIVDAPSSVMVLPRIWPLRQPRLAGRRESAEPAAARPARVGLDVYGVRDYRDGDSPRHIHWRSTARRGQLVIREYEQDAQEATVLLLDTRGEPLPLPRGGEGDGEGVFEDLVRAAASVADALVRSGRPLRIAGSVNGALAAAGPSRGAVMRWLAEIGTDGSVAPSRVYEALYAPGTPVVVLTADPGSIGYFAERGIPCTAIVARAGDDLRARLEAGV